MKLLTTERCRSCGAALSIPVTHGRVRVQCGKCLKLNVREEGRWSTVEMPEPEVREVPSAPKIEPVGPTAESVAPPSWSSDMLKAELVAIAESFGIDTDGMLKREVIEALENLG